MICRNCKHRIPDHFLQAESFKCLHCGKVYRRKSSSVDTAAQNPANNSVPAKEKNWLLGLLCKRIWKFPIWAYLLGTVLCIVIAACDPSDDKITVTQPNEVPSATAITYTPSPTTALSEETNYVWVAETTAIPTPTAQPAATFPSIAANNVQELATAPAMQSIQMNDSGERVVALQKRLIVLGYLNANADGQFGQKTKSAVEEYQRAAGLPVTGICDYDTYDSMTSSNAPRKVSSSSNSNKSNDETVWIAPYKGKKYHDKNCQHLDDARSVQSISLSQAKKKGYTPCGTCR